MNLCGICDLFIQFYHVTSPVSSLFKEDATVHFLWFSMSLFPGGQLILAGSVHASTSLLHELSYIDVDIM